ncbi:MAG: hypothetical protein IKN52_02805 [Victivallales bacterium]|nr:hypothetical protein [Victivallales bacterium]
MKKLLGTMLFAICLMAMAVELPPRHHINVWSGKEQSLPFSAQTEWRIESDHGRFLAGGGAANPINVSFPLLTAKETAVLFIDGKKTASISIRRSYWMASPGRSTAAVMSWKPLASNNKQMASGLASSSPPPRNSTE